MSDSADDHDNVVPMARARRNGNGNGGPPFGERLARIESRMENMKENMATKTDIEKLRVWILAGVIAAFVIALSIGFLVPRG